MKGFLLKLWTDPTYFAVVCRSLLYAAGQAVALGVFGALDPKIGAAISALAFLVPAGDTTPPNVVELAKTAEKTAVGDPVVKE